MIVWDLLEVLKGKHNSYQLLEGRGLHALVEVPVLLIGVGLGLPDSCWMTLVWVTCNCSSPAAREATSSQSG